MRKGIDVSSYQGNIDWEEVKENVDFAIIRCGYGNNIASQDDVYYRRNVEECTRLGIPFGVYLFSYATDIAMSQSEVEHTLRLIKDYQLEYPVFIDIETRAQLELPKEELVKVAKHYCEEMESHGYYVGIYASLSTLNGILDSNELDIYDKWVAEWSKDFTYKGKSGLWQNTDNDRIPGIDTRVDGNIAFYDYPTIIREHGLNHLKKEEEPERKFKKGDHVYVNGSVYKKEDGKEVITKVKNVPVTITSVSKKDVKAPYHLDIKGYSKEDSLSYDKLTCPSICGRIIQFILNLWKRSE